MHQGFRKELWTKLVEVLIIDEISMLSGEWLDNLERMLRELTHYYGRGEFQQYLRMPMKDIPAFGGIHEGQGRQVLQVPAGGTLGGGVPELERPPTCVKNKQAIYNTFKPQSTARNSPPPVGPSGAPSAPRAR